MRIGYLTYGLDRDPTGIGRYAVALLEALAELPDAPQIVLLTTERDDTRGLWRQFEHHALPGCGYLPALMTVGQGALSLAAGRLRLDLVHDPNGIAPFFGPRRGARRVVTLHDAFTYVQPQAQNWLDNWRYRWQLPRALRRADAVITVSACSRRDIAAHLGLAAERIAVIPEGVEAHFRPVPDCPARRATLARYGIAPPYLLYLGGINARKNVARLLEAYARLRERRPGIALVIAGKRQWLTGEIDATFERLALGDAVRFTGYVEDADLPALYSAAEAFVFPSLYEGFGLPPLEAMACGTPVVTSRVSALPELVGDAAVMIDPYDVPGLAAAIERVLTDDALRTDLRRRGLARSCQFTWRRAAGETLAIYNSIVQRTTDDRC
jgi:glycosyltransferase involved in cell wall biosynthesis